MREKSTPATPNASPLRESHDFDLTTPAGRALAEAAQRRAESVKAAEAAREVNGPSGAEPTRFGDWERKGIAYDF
ncbi:DUF1674 domain-containing protein [Candidatus Phycosocius bacilliformis]|uniref:DUF1674 domain-containing protein n=1 Tax=Candidatus Phycosocius bacilliformis TaxID=1445552 RepID=UPI000D5946B1|nr:DUF1674 domain-containing protein [Candidatus Phycosocius bacilliformis]